MPIMCYSLALASLPSYFKVWAVAGKNEGNRVALAFVYQLIIQIGHVLIVLVYTSKKKRNSNGLKQFIINLNNSKKKNNHPDFFCFISAARLFIL